MMLTIDEILNRLRSELPTLKSKFNVKRVGVFGSYAENRATPESDIDLVVEFEQPIGLGFMDLIDYLEDLFEKKVDALTPEGIASIRVKRVAEAIRRSIIYA